MLNMRCTYACVMSERVHACALACARDAWRIIGKAKMMARWRTRVLEACFQSCVSAQNAQGRAPTAAFGDEAFDRVSRPKGLEATHLRSDAAMPLRQGSDGRRWSAARRRRASGACSCRSASRQCLPLLAPPVHLELRCARTGPASARRRHSSPAVSAAHPDSVIVYPFFCISLARHAPAGLELTSSNSPLATAGMDGMGRGGGGGRGKGNGITAGLLL